MGGVGRPATEPTMVPGMEKRLPVLDSLRELLKVPRVAPSHNSYFQANLEPEFV